MRSANSGMPWRLYIAGVASIRGRPRARGAGVLEVSPGGSNALVGRVPTLRPAEADVHGPDTRRESGGALRRAPVTGIVACNRRREPQIIESGILRDHRSREAGDALVAGGRLDEPHADRARACTGKAGRMQVDGYAAVGARVLVAGNQDRA